MIYIYRQIRHLWRCWISNSAGRFQLAPGFTALCPLPGRAWSHDFSMHYVACHALRLWQVPGADSGPRPWHKRNASWCLVALAEPQAFTRFPNVQIEAAPFLARQGSHHMPAPMIVQAFICRECIQLTQLNIMRCESDAPRLNCLWRMYRSIFVGFKKWRPAHLRRSWWNTWYQESTELKHTESESEHIIKIT